MRLLLHLNETQRPISSENIYKLYSSTNHLHDNGEDRNNLKKRSVRLYPWIFPYEEESKKSGDNSDRKVVLSSECQCK
ncbi:hypothetical protein SAMN05428987_4426 [Paenibacillus sp. CF095]|nr:hypothetical protein SAMN05428987_4426 [Paenibacillus sp. CF095]